jgi:Flp pilus assembly protein TadB
MANEQIERARPVALPTALRDPTPFVSALSVLWLVGLAVSLATGHWAGWGQACLAGLVVGALGFALFLSQRRAARRGDRTAQRGLQ